MTRASEAYTHATARPSAPRISRFDNHSENQLIKVGVSLLLSDRAEHLMHSKLPVLNAPELWYVTDPVVLEHMNANLGELVADSVA
jgi:hypothetical protein